MKGSLFFVACSSNGEKKAKLVRLIADLYLKKRKIQVFVPSEQAGSYLDQLLWKEPKELFIPHEFTEATSAAPIQISLSQKKRDGAEILVNLSQEIIEECGQWHEIYEFFDCADAQKTALSEQKREAYLTRGVVVSTLPEREVHSRS